MNGAIPNHPPLMQKQFLQLECATRLDFFAVQMRPTATDDVLRMGREELDDLAIKAGCNKASSGRDYSMSDYDKMIHFRTFELAIGMIEVRQRVMETTSKKMSFGSFVSGYK
jgi:hypothetical protein